MTVYKPQKPAKPRRKHQGTFCVPTLETYFEETVVHQTFNDMLSYMVDSPCNMWAANLGGTDGLTKLIPQIRAWLMEHPDQIADGPDHMGQLVGLRIGKTEITDYARQYQCEELDPEILAKRIGIHEEWVWDNFGVNTGRTRGAVGRTLVKAFLPCTVARLNPGMEAFMRDAAEGGLILPPHSNRVYRDVVQVDMNAMHMTQARKGHFPSGVGIWTGKPEPEAWLRLKLRCDPAKVDFPFILLHYGDGKRGRVYGDGEAVLCPEAREFAVQSGYEILEIIDGIVFEEFCDPFKEISEVFEKLEYDPLVSREDRKWVKGVRNSLIGSLNPSGSPELIVFSHGELEPEGADLVTTVDGFPIDGAYRIVQEDKSRAMMMPHWYALIVQRSMIELAKVFQQLKPEDRLGGTVDSAWMPVSALEYLDIDYGMFGYGKWKTEYVDVFQGWPHNYWFISQVNGEVNIKCSAVPEEVIKEHFGEFKAALNGEMPAVVRWKPESLDAVLGVRFERIRRLLSPYDVDGYSWDEKTGVFSSIDNRSLLWLVTGFWI